MSNRIHVGVPIWPTIFSVGQEVPPLIRGGFKELFVVSKMSRLVTLRQIFLVRLQLSSFGNLVWSYVPNVADS